VKRNNCEAPSYVISPFSSYFLSYVEMFHPDQLELKLNILCTLITDFNFLKILQCKANVGYLIAVKQSDEYCGRNT